MSTSIFQFKFGKFENQGGGWDDHKLSGMECLNQQIREGLKKKVENSTKGGGVCDGLFSTKKKTNNNMVLKHWILPNNQSKTHLFFFFNFWMGGGPFSA